MMLKKYAWGCAFVLFACDTSIKTTEKTGGEDSTQHKKILLKYSPKLQVIFETDEWVLRKLNFDDDIRKIQKPAEAKVLPAEATKTGYSINLNIYEIADLVFLYDKNQKIKGFHIETYLSSQEATDSLGKDFAAYFAEKYQTKFQNSSRKHELLNDSLHIIIEDVSTQKSPGLQVSINRIR
ncbi:MAG: hypothetical protein H7Y04_00965 [Verrucomicrobia bacterium]|nr:hypothetical protein [Cytophagales bacterium]